MARWKFLCRSWIVMLLIVLVSPSVRPRPSSDTTVETISNITTTVTAATSTEKTTEQSDRIIKSTSTKQHQQNLTTEPNTGSRDVKSKTPVIGESIKVVANQLLQSPSNITPVAAIVEDTRIPPKLKNQIANKHKIKTRQEDSQDNLEHSHAGIAVPVTMEELETENKISDMSSESSTSSEGISTWILLSNSPNIENVSIPTEATKPEDTPKKSKPNHQKTKTKRPQQNKTKRPIIAGINKSDLIAGGSAISENVLNKIKDTVMTNVQKNSNNNRTSTLTTTTVVPSTITTLPKKEITTKSPSTVIAVTKETTKVIKKKNKIKQKVTTLSPSTVENSALLPMEPKEQEIELEVSTPATSTKKPKRSTTTRKKNKTKKRKTSKPSTEKETESVETKNSNKTKVAKPSKKPSPITTQIYNYLSREVMPSVGVGIVGLAGLVGLASYFLYPFATPVRRTFEVDKKDDLYKHNAEEYANEGNGHPEEEMLGTVLAGMPSHAKHKLNPYANQTPHRYHVKKEPEQNLRYRHVVSSYDPSYNSHYPQQKTGIAHGATYSQVDPVHYNTQYETRHVYKPENNQYTHENINSYTQYPAVEPIYAAPHTGPSGLSSYASDTSNTAYGAQSTQDTNFKPVYPFEGQVYSETTSNPMSYPSTSLYLGSNTEAGQQEEFKYSDNSSSDVDNKFVVGNVPKELVDSATPAVVPEHGPRKLNRKRRNTKRSIATSIEEALKLAKEKELFISNDIEESLGGNQKYEATVIQITTPKEDKSITTTEKHKESENKNDKKATVNENNGNDIYVHTVFSQSPDSVTSSSSTSNPKSAVVESVSTFPLDTHQAIKVTSETEMSNELDATTKSFKIYEVFTSSTQSTNLGSTSQDFQKLKQQTKAQSYSMESTTQYKNMNTETTTDSKSEFTSTFIPPISDIKEPNESVTTKKPKPTYGPEVITYPPYNQEGGFFTFLKRLIDFKYRLGLSILQTTSESLNRYLRSMSHSVQNVVKATQNGN